MVHLISMLVLVQLVVAQPRQLNRSHRYILVFGPAAGDPIVKDQLELLSHNGAGLKERNLIVHSYLGEDPRFKEFNVEANRFCVILVGKDGFEKFRSLEPVTAKHLYRLIDAMPMRQAEMKSRGSEN